MIEKWINEYTIFNNFKEKQNSDFYKWLKIRQELTNKIKNVINHGMFTMNKKRMLIRAEHVKRKH